LPPTSDDWRRVICYHLSRTLARTTGITVEGFHFRGSNLDLLITLFGETQVDVLVDPEDFRTVHVVHGNELVVLVNADVDETTPVLSFSDAKSRERAVREAALAHGASIRTQFRRDVFAAAVKTGKGKIGSVGGAKLARQKVKHQHAVEQARLRPLPSQGATGVLTALDDFGLDQLAALPVFDKKTGEAL
jgi:putative transposase